VVSHYGYNIVLLLCLLFYSIYLPHSHVCLNVQERGDAEHASIQMHRHLRQSHEGEVHTQGALLISLISINPFISFTSINMSVYPSYFSSVSASPYPTSILVPPLLHSSVQIYQEFADAVMTGTVAIMDGHIAAMVLLITQPCSCEVSVTPDRGASHI
jgi:hypothetical protein